MFCWWLICPNYEFICCTLSTFFLAEMIVWQVLRSSEKKIARCSIWVSHFLVIYAFCFILWEQHCKNIFQVQTISSKNFSGIQCSGSFLLNNSWLLNTHQQKLTLLIFVNLIFKFPNNSIVLKYRWWQWWVLAGGEGN